MERKDIGRRLATGVSAKLEFDFVCERANSFSEYYLHGAINEIVAALVSPTAYRINTGYAHDALKREADSGSGRHREVDFFIQPYEIDEGAVCIEAKWAESRHCSWDRILLDVCRLALVHEHSPMTECLFVLSGSTPKVTSALQSLTANMPTRRGKGKSEGLLELPGDNQFSFKRTYPLKDWGGRFAGNGLVLDGLPKRKNGKPNVPVAIVSDLVRSHVSRTDKWQTVVWRISSRRASLT